MYSAVLSVLLMGVFPLLQDTRLDAAPLASLTIASPSPIAESIAASPLLESVSAAGIVILDLETGQQLYARNPDARRPIGSLTKLMTALLLVENRDLPAEVTVPQNVTRIAGSKAFVRAGQKFTMGDLLTVLLVGSSNDAAETLARFDKGSESAFVRAMNNRAQVLGLSNTAFANASGFDDDNQWSTARDIAVLASHVLRYQVLRDRLSTREATVYDSTGRALAVSHTHMLLHESPAVVAGKTGTTAGAKQCLFSVITSGGREYAVILLGSQDRYADMRVILSMFTDL